MAQFGKSDTGNGSATPLGASGAHSACLIWDEQAERFEHDRSLCSGDLSDWPLPPSPGHRSRLDHFLGLLRFGRGRALSKRRSKAAGNSPEVALARLHTLRMGGAITEEDYRQRRTAIEAEAKRD